MNIYRIKNLSITKKNELFAIWMSKDRVEHMKTLDILFYFDDEWNKIYKENRVNGFSAAKLIANTHILEMVYG